MNTDFQHKMKKTASHQDRKGRKESFKPLRAGFWRSIQFQQPRDFPANGPRHSRLELSGAAFQPVVFNRSQALHVRHAFVPFA